MGKPDKTNLLSANVEPSDSSIRKKKKKKLLIIIITAAALAIIGGIIGGIIYMNSIGTGGKKKVIKKIVVVEDDESNDNISDSASQDDAFIENNENFLIKIIKRLRRSFNDYSTDDTVESYNNDGLPVKTLYAKNYGVKGDGVSDDGVAVFKAISALSDCGPGSKLVFESDKTYYVKSVSLNYIIYLNKVNGLTVDGGNSTFLLDSNNSFASITDCKNCSIKNMHFDYKTKPAFSAACISVNTSENSATMKADRDIGLSEGETYYAPQTDWFGVINRSDSRYHMYISKYTMLSKSEKTFKIYFTDDANTKAWLGNGAMSQYGMICPMPRIGHAIERGFTISGNNGFSMSNLKIHACARFGMLISDNNGKMTFDSVNFTPAENKLDADMNFTSWRDAFHVKDNRAAISWKNCTSTGNYDDVFNISSSTLYVSDYNIAKNRVTLTWAEAKGRSYYKIKAGDTISVIDTETGESCGTATVKRVISQNGGDNTVVLKEPLTKLTTTGNTVLAFFTNRCAPNSEITNCNFSGTFRFRGPITVKNSYFFNQRTWIDLYGSLEGPVPENIVFKKCTIESGSGATVIIGANSGNTGKNGYHVKDIVFDSCSLDSKSLSIYESDEAFVKLRDCKENDGTVIPDR